MRAYGLRSYGDTEMKTRAPSALETQPIVSELNRCQMLQAYTAHSRCRRSFNPAVSAVSLAGKDVAQNRREFLTFFRIASAGARGEAADIQNL
jgi:hypothetical protein